MSINKLASKPPSVRFGSKAAAKNIPPEAEHPRATSSTNVAVSGPAQRPPRSSPRAIASTSQPQTDRISRSTGIGTMDRARDVRNPATQSRLPPTRAGGEVVVPVTSRPPSTLPAHNPEQWQEGTEQTKVVELLHRAHAHLASQQASKAAPGQTLLPSIQLQQDDVSGSGATSKCAFPMSAATTPRQPITPSTVTLSGSPRAAPLDSVRTISSAGTRTVSPAGGLMAAPELGRWSAPSDGGGCVLGMSSDPSLASSVHTMTVSYHAMFLFCGLSVASLRRNTRILPLFNDRWRPVGGLQPVTALRSHQQLRLFQRQRRPIRRQQYPSRPARATGSETALRTPSCPHALSFRSSFCEALIRGRSDIQIKRKRTKRMSLTAVDTYGSHSRLLSRAVSPASGMRTTCKLAQSRSSRTSTGSSLVIPGTFDSIITIAHSFTFYPSPDSAVLVRDFELVTVRPERPKRVAEITMKLSSNALELPSVHSIHHSMRPPTRECPRATLRRIHYIRKGY